MFFPHILFPTQREGGFCPLFARKKGGDKPPYETKQMPNQRIDKCFNYYNLRHLFFQVVHIFYMRFMCGKLFQKRVAEKWQFYTKIPKSCNLVIARGSEFHVNQPLEIAVAEVHNCQYMSQNIRFRFPRTPAIKPLEISTFQRFLLSKKWQKSGRIFQNVMWKSGFWVWKTMWKSVIHASLFHPLS